MSESMDLSRGKLRIVSENGHGSDTKVYLNGVEIQGLTSIRFEASCDRSLVATVQTEHLIGEVDIEFAYVTQRLVGMHGNLDLADFLDHTVLLDRPLLVALAQLSKQIEETGAANLLDAKTLEPLNDLLSTLDIYRRGR